MNKMKWVLALIAAVGSFPASAQNTLLPSGQWFCRADTLVMCKSDGACDKRQSRISVLVDFANDNVSSLNIANHKAPLKHVDALGDVIVFSDWIGNVMTIREINQNNIVSYDFKVILFMGDPLIHFGTCNRM